MCTWQLLCCRLMAISSASNSKPRSQTHSKTIPKRTHAPPIARRMYLSLQSITPNIQIPSKRKMNQNGVTSYKHLQAATNSLCISSNFVTKTQVLPSWPGPRWATPAPKATRLNKRKCSEWRGGARNSHLSCLAIPRKIRRWTIPRISFVKRPASFD